jgi:O-methyltransferase involved in polyketide biosynthesis
MALGALGPVEETLLITLYGRALLTRQASGPLSDPKAVEMVDAIDYDFTRFDSGMSPLRCALRTRIFDLWVDRWLDLHPAGTVVEIGVGLNTRYERLDNGRARWFELDLAEVIALRRRFFADTERRAMVTGSVLDEAWMDTVGATSGPWLFVAEGVLVYLSEHDVRAVVSRLIRRFPGSWLAVDAWGHWMRDHQDEHDILRNMEARLQWFCDDIRELDARVEVLESCTYASAPADVLELLPPPLEAMVAASANDTQLQNYRMNLVQLGTADPEGT